MRKFSNATLKKAALATLGSMVASMTIVLVVVPLLGGQADGLGLLMSALCPLIIAFPATIFQFHQTAQLADAKSEIERMHLELTDLYAALARSHCALEEKARYDGMTGLLSREAFFNMLEAESRRGVDGTVLIADADHFKAINDTHGHQAGDSVLTGIAKAIEQALGQQDFCGRIGGEEFAIFLLSADRAQARIIAETIRSNVEGLDIRQNGERIPVSISQGGFRVEAGFSATAAVSEADRRLYCAKRLGRNRVEFELHAAPDRGTVPAIARPQAAGGAYRERIA